MKKSNPQRTGLSKAFGIFGSPHQYQELEGHRGGASDSCLNLFQAAWQVSTSRQLVWSQNLCDFSLKIFAAQLHFARVGLSTLIAPSDREGQGGSGQFQELPETSLSCLPFA